LYLYKKLSLNLTIHIKLLKRELQKNYPKPEIVDFRLFSLKKPVKSRLSFWFEPASGPLV